MKMTLISVALITLALAACRKDEQTQPENGPVRSKLRPKIGQDTIPDHAGIKVRLVKDSSSSDETMIEFDHNASINYNANDDALYFPGFGQVSLSSISRDGRNMAIYALPYKPGLFIGLTVITKKDGDYSLGISYEKGLPPDLHAWIKDAYMQDSTDVCSGNYNFKVVKADTNSFGSKRFSLVFKQAPPPPGPH